jgi:phosphatidylinositol-bisphosphatase
MQISALGSVYDIIAQHKIGGIQIAVYAKKKLANRITGVLVLDVACGIGNVLTNKGAICVLLRIKKKTLAFVSAHFAAHDDKVAERNADYARITQSIVSRAPISWLKKDSPVLLSRKMIAAAAKKESAKVNRGARARVKKENKNSFSFENMLTAAGIPADSGKSGVKSEDVALRRAAAEHISCETVWPFDATVFLGDLNYRVDLPRLEVRPINSAHITL